MGIIQDLKDKVLGTDAQNDAAKERMAKEDAKNPDTVQAKVNRAVDKITPVKKAKGGMIGSASKRADGIAQRGKTRGKIC